MTQSMTQATDIEVLRIPSWQQHSWLRHGFSTRPGGVSTVYGGNTLNLGWTKEDSPAAVTENRRRFLQSITNTPEFALATIRQIHSPITLTIDTPANLATPEGKAVLEGDGLITTLPNILLGIGTADCVHVLTADTRQRIVAAFHAGWRGTVARIVESGIAQLRQTYRSRTEDLIAAIGPCIGPCCYAVGEEVQTAFAANFPHAIHLFHPAANETHLDLWKANRLQLIAAGIPAAQTSILKLCTACSQTAHGQRRFFSHRAEHGVAGRMLNVVGIADPARR
jgi:polyphenol oxidase